MTQQPTATSELVTEQLILRRAFAETLASTMPGDVTLLFRGLIIASIARVSTSSRVPRIFLPISHPFPRDAQSGSRSADARNASRNTRLAIRKARISGGTFQGQASQVSRDPLQGSACPWPCVTRPMKRALHPGTRATPPERDPTGGLMSPTPLHFSGQASQSTPPIAPTTRLAAHRSNGCRKAAAGARILRSKPCRSPLSKRTACS